MRDDCCCDMGRRDDRTVVSKIWVSTSNSTHDASFYQRVIDRMNKYFPHQDNNDLVRKAFIKSQINNSPYRFDMDTNGIYTDEITVWNNKYFEECKKMKECYIPTEEEIVKHITCDYSLDDSEVTLKYTHGNKSFVMKITCDISWLFSKRQEVISRGKQVLAKRVNNSLKTNNKKEQVKMYNLNEQQLDKNIENLRKINGSIEIEGSRFSAGKTTITLPTFMLNCVRVYDPVNLCFEPACACNAPTLTPTNGINIPKAGIPNVSRVETYNNRVVKVVFTDGTFTKAVCSENDTFDLDTGITICIMKRFFGKDNKTGTREYNRLIRNVHNTMDKIEKEKERLTKEKAERKEKQKKLEQKRIAGREAARQEYIDDIAQGVEQALAKRMDDAK